MRFATIGIKGQQLKVMVTPTKIMMASAIFVCLLSETARKNFAGDVVARKVAGQMFLILCLMSVMVNVYVTQQRGLNNCEYAQHYMHPTMGRLCNFQGLMWVVPIAGNVHRWAFPCSTERQYDNIYFSCGSVFCRCMVRLLVICMDVWAIDY